MKSPMPTVVAASTRPGPMILRRSPSARGASSGAIVVADSSLLKRSPLSRTTDRDRHLRKGRIPDRLPQTLVALGHTFAAKSRRFRGSISAGADRSTTLDGQEGSLSPTTLVNDPG